jgi:hypothetical protein
MFPAIAKSVEEKDNFDVVEIDQTHVHETSVHGDDLIGAIAKRKVQIVAKIEGLLQQDQLSLGSEFLMTLAKFIEYEVRSGEVRDGIVICLRDAFKNETAEGAIVCLPDFVHLRMCGSVRLG